MSPIDSADQRPVESAPTGGGVAEVSLTAAPSCKRCGVSCPGGLRLGFVRHRRRFDSGLTERSIRQALQPLPHDHCP